MVWLCLDDVISQTWELWLLNKELETQEIVEFRWIDSFK